MFGRRILLIAAILLALVWAALSTPQFETLAAKAVPFVVDWVPGAYAVCDAPPPDTNACTVDYVRGDGTVIQWGIGEWR